MSRSKADAIREMTDKELADFLCEVIVQCKQCVAYGYCSEGHTGMIDWFLYILS